MMERTPTQVLKLANDCKKSHENIKIKLDAALSDLDDKIKSVDELKVIVNDLISELDKTEIEYVNLMEELTKMS